MSKSEQILPRVLVLAQFAIAAILVLSTHGASLASLAMAVAALGAMIAIWAWLKMGLLKVRVMPHVREGAVLLRSGPYRWVRHPMYLGLLIFTAGMILADSRPWRVFLWANLLGVLWAKTAIEERLLTEKFSDYREYQRSTGRLLPKIRKPPPSQPNPS